MTSPLSRRWRKLRSRPRRGWIQFKVLLGLNTSMESPDREVLEQVILPYYGAREDVRRVLWVGCAWYTHHYWKHFRGKEYWTLDYDPRKRKYAGRNHVTASLADIEEHFDPGTLDLILCNGVYGWGLDDPAGCERAFEGCRSRLRVGGEFVLGWNDVPERTPFPLSDLDSLARFGRREFPPLSTWCYRVDSPSRHTFDFFVR